MKAGQTRLLLIGILLLAFVSRIWRLHLPENYVFDEVYHAVTVKLMAQNDPRAFEWWHGPTEPNTAIDWLHPPLAKYSQALLVNILGSSSFSWRLSSALFGVGVVWLVFQLSQELFKNERLSLWAAFLTALDGLVLVQSRTAMNDIHVTFFILLTIWFYWKYRKAKLDKWLLWTGLGLGLAISTKWSGFLLVGALGLIEVIRLIKSQLSKFELSKLINRGLLFYLAFILIPITIYIASYGQMYLQGKGWTHFKELHHQIWWYQTNLTATHDYQSRPVQWFLNLRPTWFHVTYEEPNFVGNIYTVANPILAWLGALAVTWTLVNLLWRAVVGKNHYPPALATLLVLYFGVWLPWELSPRILFHYHYLPAVPLMAIILAYWLNQLWELPVKAKTRWNKVVVLVVLLLVLADFALWYPHWTAIPVSKTWAKELYFILPSWK